MIFYVEGIKKTEKTRLEGNRLLIFYTFHALVQRVSFTNDKSWETKKLNGCTRRDYREQYYSSNIVFFDITYVDIF